MSCLGKNYNPQPTRTWYRIQNRCSYDNEVELSSTENESIAMKYKASVLQYKKNSSNITKNQRYSQIAKGKWVNRTTTWATQTASYTNPNTSSYQRVNYVVVPLAYIPYLYPSSNCPVLINPVTNQFEIKEGGNLLCNNRVNVCNN